MNSEHTDTAPRTTARIAYRCPFCGCVISADISPELLDSGFTLPCTECRKSALEMTLSADGKVKLLVPCLMCPHPHPYTVSKDIFFKRDIFLLSCSFTGLDICFIGDEDYVEDEIDRTGAEIAAMTESEDETESKAQKSADNMMVADTSVMREVLFAIGKLDEEKKIKCSCGSSAIKVLLDYDKAVVVCKVCGKRVKIPARTRFDANDAIDLEFLTIE